MATAEERIDKLVQDRFDSTDAAIDKLTEGMPAIEKKIFSEIVSALRELEVSNGKIKNTVANVKYIRSVVKKRLTDIVKNPKYVNAVSEFIAQIEPLAKNMDTQANIQKGVNGQ